MGKLSIFAWGIAAFLAAGAVAAEEAFLSESVSTFRDNSLNISAGAGVAILAQDLGWGVNVTLDRQIHPSVPIYMGLDLGAHSYPDFTKSAKFSMLPLNVQNVEMTTIQFLPTFYYRFYVPMFMAAYPYIGISIGPTVVMTKGYVDRGGQKFLAHDATVIPEFLVRPGITIYAAPSFGFSIEPKFGWLRTEFVFLPQFNAVVSL